MGRRGPKAKVQHAVERLEKELGNIQAADLVRQTVGLPPRVLTPAEEFVRDVQQIVTSQPIAFHASSPEEAQEWVALVLEIPSPNEHMKYTARLTTPSRIEVSLIPAAEPHFTRRIRL